MFRCDTTETRNCWIYVEDDHAGDNITVGTTTFDVVDPDGTELQASGTATKADNGTATPDIYGAVDGSNLTAEESFKVRFTVTIGSEIFVVPVPGKAVETPI